MGPLGTGCCLRACVSTENRLGRTATEKDVFAQYPSQMFASVNCRLQECFPSGGARWMSADACIQGSFACNTLFHAQNGLFWSSSEH